MKRWIVVAWLLTLAVATVGIAANERVLRDGEVLYLRLAPVDPRSLMQGDYMALNFTAGIEIAAAQGAQHKTDRRDVTVVIRRDANHIGQFVRLHDGTPLADGEQLLRVQNVPTRWGGNGVQVSTNAWFFEEGQAKRYERAQYGEFRVDRNGHALLVGMRGEGLSAL
ncbi:MULTISPECIES: GDYXXLXY domain-containing protein [Cupriavidus]|uniref:GDYXXLXY domain-containing protein n=1 Tax=Cupriavidus pauculus TaxID=82633 RepID=A0A5P2H743_9BURK|nr:GDYXXLXY domain-containing protein [Cupriavidus pauculus]QET03528.1 GDYXXLXY domain-containing protein [Cupriavidus pauculus]